MGEKESRVQMSIKSTCFLRDDTAIIEKNILIYEKEDGRFRKDIRIFGGPFRSGRRLQYRKEEEFGAKTVVLKRRVIWQVEEADEERSGDH